MKASTDPDANPTVRLADDETPTAPLADGATSAVSIPDAGPPDSPTRQQRLWPAIAGVSFGLTILMGIVMAWPRIGAGGSTSDEPAGRGPVSAVGAPAVSTTDDATTTSTETPRTTERRTTTSAPINEPDTARFGDIVTMEPVGDPGVATWDVLYREVIVHEPGGYQWDESDKPAGSCVTLRGVAVVIDDAGQLNPLLRDTWHDGPTFIVDGLVLDGQHEHLGRFGYCYDAAELIYGQSNDWFMLGATARQPVDFYDTRFVLEGAELRFGINGIEVMAGPEHFTEQPGA